MTGKTVGAGLLAAALFGAAGAMAYRHYATPVDPDNGNLILDSDANVAGPVVEVMKLGEQGPSAGPDVPARLAALLKDPSPEIRGEAARALGKVGPRTPEARDALVAAGKDEDPVIRAAVLGALDDLARRDGPNDPEVQARYESYAIASLADPASIVRRAALTSLRTRPEGSLRDPGAIARAELAAMDGKDPVVAAAALAALGELPRAAGPKADAVVLAVAPRVPELLRQMPDADPRTAPALRGVIEALASAKVKAPEADAAKILETFRALLADPRPGTRGAMLGVLPAVSALVGPNPSLVREAVAPGLSDADARARRTSVEALRDALSRDPSLAPVALESLRPLLKDADPSVRAAALAALAGNPEVRSAGGDALKAEVREATRAQIADLARPDAPGREFAAWSLSWTDPEDADAALEALRALKDDKDRGLKRRVTTAIQKLEAAKAAGTWPNPEWPPLRLGPPPAEMQAPPLSPRG